MTVIAVFTFSCQIKDKSFPYTATKPFLNLHSLASSLLTIWTRGQRQNESQKPVIIDMMKSKGERASKIWPVVYYLNHFWENLILTFHLDQRSRLSTLKSLNAPYWVVPWY